MSRQAALNALFVFALLCLGSVSSGALPWFIAASLLNLTYWLYAPELT